MEWSLLTRASKALILDNPVLPSLIQEKTRNSAERSTQKLQKMDKYFSIQYYMSLVSGVKLSKSEYPRVCTICKARWA